MSNRAISLELPDGTETLNASRAEVAEPAGREGTGEAGRRSRLPLILPFISPRDSNGPFRAPAASAPALLLCAQRLQRLSCRRSDERRTGRRQVAKPQRFSGC